MTKEELQNKFIDIGGHCAIYELVKNSRMGFRYIKKKYQKRRRNMDVIQFISKHWAEIGVAWFVIKVMTAIQDAVDAEPSGLKPPFGKLLYYMPAIGQSLIIGNRPASITPPTGGK